MEFNEQTGNFNATYIADFHVKAPTLIFAHKLHYEHGEDIIVSCNGDVLYDQGVQSKAITVTHDRDGLISILVNDERLHGQAIDIKITKLVPQEVKKEIKTPEEYI